MDDRSTLGVRTEMFVDVPRWGKRVDLLLIRTIDGKRHAGVVSFEELPEGHFANPTATIGITEAQQLMDDLWHCGLRPSEGSGSAGALAATERHLEDMRRLVFDERIEVSGPDHPVIYPRVDHG